MTRRRAAGLTAGIAGFLVLAVAGVMVFALPMLGTSDDPTPTVPESEAVAEELDPTPSPVHGGTYIEGDVGFPATLNPLLASSTSERTLSTLLYRGLVQPDRQGSPGPDLAVDWTISDDARRYELTLDPDARWHDGEPVRVDDVLFTISAIQDAEFPGDPALARFWRAISVSRSGDQSVEFALMEPYAGFLNYLTVPILPKHLLSDRLPGDLADLELDWPTIGTGPFMISAVDEEAGEIHLDSVGSEGDSPYLDSVVFRYFETRDEATEAFRSGEIDGLGYVPLEELADNDLLPEGARVYAPTLSGYTALYFNMRQPLLQDVLTRRALESAINRDQLVAGVLGGHAAVGTSPIPQTLGAHAPGDHLGYDPDRARTMLEEAGWRLENGEEIRQRDGQRLVLPLLVNGEDAQRLALASQIQEQLRVVGVAVEVVALSRGEVEQALAARQFTAVLFGWHTETGDPDCFQMWHSSQADDGMNFTGFAHAHADELLVDARRTADIERRSELYARFQQIFAEQVPAVVLFYPRYHFAVSDRIEGAQPVPLLHPSDRIRQIHKWYSNTVLEEREEQVGQR